MKFILIFGPQAVGKMTAIVAGLMFTYVVYK